MGEDVDPGLCYFEALDAVHDVLTNTWCKPERVQMSKALVEWSGQIRCVQCTQRVMNRIGVARNVYLPSAQKSTDGLHDTMEIG